MGRGGWDSEALKDLWSCSLLQLEDLVGRSQRRGESRGSGGQRGWMVCGGVSDAPLHVLSVHFIQQRRGVSGDGHGRALDHGAGRWPWSHPLSLLPPLRLLLLQPLLRHLAPVHR